PRSRLVGQRVAGLAFREKYGHELGAIWRKGEGLRSELEEQAGEPGDAPLLTGPRDKLRLLQPDRDFPVFAAARQLPVQQRKAPVAGAILLGVVLAALLGWLPIYMAALIGATLTVLTGCLTMEEAYRAIEWRAIFLIAGMLPLGTAMDDTGAARFLAEQMMGL